MRVLLVSTAIWFITLGCMQVKPPEITTTVAPVTTTTVATTTTTAAKCNGCQSSYPAATVCPARAPDCQLLGPNVMVSVYMDSNPNSGNKDYVGCLVAVCSPNSVLGENMILESGGVSTTAQSLLCNMDDQWVNTITKAPVTFDAFNCWVDPDGDF